jgi:hypothetical protein
MNREEWKHRSVAAHLTLFADLQEPEEDKREESCADEY